MDVACRRHAGAGTAFVTSKSAAGAELSVDATQLVRHCYQSGQLLQMLSVNT